MRSSDWSSDVCSADLPLRVVKAPLLLQAEQAEECDGAVDVGHADHRVQIFGQEITPFVAIKQRFIPAALRQHQDRMRQARTEEGGGHRSEEHTSELQSLMRISYADFCLEKKNI